MLTMKMPSYFKERRNQLMKQNPHSIFIFPSADEVLRNPDVYFGFRQESNFYYLTGFEEPESFLVLAPTPKQPNGYKTILFVRKRDPDKELWEGERYGVDRAKNVFEVDETYPFEEFGNKLIDFLDDHLTVYFRISLNENKDRMIYSALERFRVSRGRSGISLLSLADPAEVLGEMRILKKPEEIQFLSKACQVTANAHLAAMRETRPGMLEFEIEALIEYHFKKNHCQRVGYGSIVATGKNATCLHYRSNNETMRDGELLLIDAGGEHCYYTSDITRTFPVGRKFTKSQAKLYQLVLDAQKAGIALARPGGKLPEIHQRVCEVLTEGLLSLGLLSGNQQEIIKLNYFKRFYPHNTSHWLGMDVHDVGLYKKNNEPRVLEPGMVLTIEPGIYTQPHDLQTPEEYRCIGIRIEDDILITPQGHEILTKDAPKELDAIEKIRNF